MNRSKIICVLFLTLFISGCSDLRSIEIEKAEQVLFYNGDIYDFASSSYWDVVEGFEEWETVYVAIRDDNQIKAKNNYNTKAKALKSDDQILIIKYGISEKNYYIKRNYKPNPYKSNIKEVILYNENYKVLLGDKERILFIDYLRNNEQNSASLKFEKWKSNFSCLGIYIEFVDFPLSYYYGYYGLSKSGEYAYSTWNFYDYNEKCVVLPSSLQNLLH